MFVEALAALADASLFSGLRHPFDGTPPVVNLPTMVSGGITPWQHPPQFEAIIEIRSIPGMSAEHVERTMREVLDARALRSRVELTIESWGEPVSPVEDTPLLAACARALSTVTGANRLPSVFPATTDASHLTRAGIPAIPAFGPGSLHAIHRPDEWVLCADIERTVPLIHDLVTAYLGVG